MTKAKITELRQNAILVELNFRNGVGFTITDKPESEEVEKKHETKKAGRYVKFLFRREHLQKIFDAENIAKAVHARYTVAWLNSGLRVLPAPLIESYDQGVERAQVAYKEGVDWLIQNWDEIMEDNKIRLKAMFNPNDYPAKESVTDGFRLFVSTFPVPDKNDFQVDASDAVNKKLRDQFVSNVKEYEMNAQSDVAKRLGNSLGSMLEKLGSADKKIQDRTLLKMSELLIDLKALNITGNKIISDAIESAEKSFSKEVADVLNENTEYRAKKKAEATAIVDKLKKGFPRAIEF